MPHVPLVVADAVEKDAIRVLITGFGPFATFEENPSWLAVSKLHNIILEAASAAQPIVIADQEVLAEEQSAGAPAPRPIHITALKVPVTYAAVLSTVPGLHARPPKLPSSSFGGEGGVLPNPPLDGYDLVLHVGVGRKGNLRIEKLGHKLGYDMPDAEGKFAPVVKQSGDGRPGGSVGKTMDIAEHFERARLGHKFSGPIEEYVLRGFTEGYEAFAEELYTDVDVDGLVGHLREVGVEFVESSTNAGRYLCDFIYYCSLAEAQRSHPSSDNSDPAAAPIAKSGKRSKVLFVHCPPVGDPLSTEYVADALRRVVARVCSQGT